MKATPRLFLMAPLLSAALLHAGEPKQSPKVPLFKAQVELVTVDAVVVDKDGVPIRGLRREDFVIEEDGEPQNIERFEAVEFDRPRVSAPVKKAPISTNTDPALRAGRSFLVVFDDLHISKGTAKKAKQKVETFLLDAVGEGDVVTLLATGASGFWSTRMISGRDKLLSLLAEVKGQYLPDPDIDTITAREAFRISELCDKEVGQRVQMRLEAAGVVFNQEGLMPADCAKPEIEAAADKVLDRSRQRMRATLDAMTRAMKLMSGVRGRKTILLASEGFIEDFAVKELETAMRAAQSANAAIYFLRLRNVAHMLPLFNPSNKAMTFSNPASLQRIKPSMLWADSLSDTRGADEAAHETGGRVILDDKDLAKQMSRLAAESQTYYLLGYSSTNEERDGKFRRIKVKLTGKGTSVRARRGYFAPKEESAARAEGQKAPVAPSLQEALNSPYYVSDLPLKTTALIGGAAPEGKTKVSVVTDVDVGAFDFREEEGRFKDEVEMHILVTHLKTQETSTQAAKTTLNVTKDTRERVIRGRFITDPGS